MLMKKAIIAASAAIILAAGAATCWTVFGGNEDEFINENLEALMDQEIPQEEKDSCIEEEGRCVYHIDGAWVSVERHIEKGRL